MTTQHRHVIDFNGVTGAPGRIRTSDPQIRSLVLYPAELRAHLIFWYAKTIAQPKPIPRLIRPVRSGVYRRTQRKASAITTSTSSVIATGQSTIAVTVKANATDQHLAGAKPITADKAQHRKPERPT
jgi:hypothetical protein